LSRDGLRLGMRQAAPNVANPLQLADRGMRRITTGNDAQLYVDGRTAYPALHKLVREAKKTLYIETMIWHNDDAGRALAQEVVDAKKRGVDVKIMVDSIGLHFGSGRNNDPSLLAWMRSQGVDVHAFNEGIVGKQGVTITHHKIYIADNERFLTGGINVGNEYAQEWHDMLVGIAGPAAREVAGEFAINWTRTTGEALKVPEPGPIESLRAHPPGTAAVGIAVTDPIAHRYEMRGTNLKLINEAKRHIRVQMPYCSDDAMMDALKAAVRRGVEVEFIMPGINDTGTYGAIDRSEANDLIKAGVKVRFFHGGTVDGQEVERFSHLKMMIIDDAVAQVGSGNWDYRTFHKNNELNAYIADPTFISTLKAGVWDKDWQESRPASVDSLAKRPFLDKVEGFLLRGIDRFF
jgi:cardiolipin synthase